MSARKYRWFIQPLDSHTNQVLAAEISEENLKREVRCADKRKRNLWQCDYQLVNYLLRSHGHLKIKFNVFVQEGEGAIRLWNLTGPKLKKQKQSKAK